MTLAILLGIFIFAESFQPQNPTLTATLQLPTESPEEQVAYFASVAPTRVNLAWTEIIPATPLEQQRYGCDGMTVYLNANMRLNPLFYTQRLLAAYTDSILEQSVVPYEVSLPESDVSAYACQAKLFKAYLTVVSKIVEEQWGSAQSRDGGSQFATVMPAVYHMEHAGPFTVPFDGYGGQIQFAIQPIEPVKTRGR